MASVDYTWTFDTDTQGWRVLGSASHITFAGYEGSDGSPSNGSIRFNSSALTSDPIFSQQLDITTSPTGNTWESFGVPSGATVQSIQCTSVKYKHIYTDSEGDIGEIALAFRPVTTGYARVTNTSGGEFLGGLIYSNFSITKTLDWVSDTTDFSQIVDDPYTASSTPIIFLMYVNYGRAEGISYTSEFLLDTITVRIFYTSADDDSDCSDTADDPCELSEPQLWFMTDDRYVARWQSTATRDLQICDNPNSGTPIPDWEYGLGYEVNPVKFTINKLFADVAGNVTIFAYKSADEAVSFRSLMFISTEAEKGAFPDFPAYKMRLTLKGNSTAFVRRLMWELEQHDGVGT